MRRLAFMADQRRAAFRTFVQEFETTRKVLSYICNRSRYSDQSLFLRTNTEGKDLNRGDVVEVYVPEAGLNGDTYIITESNRSLTSFEYICSAYSASIYDIIPVQEPTAWAGQNQTVVDNPNTIVGDVNFTGDINPVNDNSGNLGSSSKAFNDGYFYNLYYQSLGTFDVFDDLEIIESMTPDRDDSGEIILNDDGSAKMSQEKIHPVIRSDPNNGFIDAGKAQQLMFGAIRQLNSIIKSLQAEIKNLKRGINS